MFPSLIEELQKVWPANGTVNIVCHGHSVPAGYFKTPHVDTFNAYPHLFHQALKARFPLAVMNVIVTAIGGEHSERGAERFDRDVLPHRPDLLTIDYSLNDRGIGLERARTAWTSMIDRAKSAGIGIILLTPTSDQTVNPLDPATDLGRHAAQVRQLAKEHSLPLADSYEAFAGYVRAGGALDDLLSQVNHPNRRGHELVLQELRRAIGVT